VCGERIIATANLALARDAPAPLDEVFPADDRAPGRARRLLAGFEDLRLPRGSRADLMVVVSEAVTNAVVHAYAPAGDGMVHLKAWAEASGAAVLIADHGRGLAAERSEPGPGTVQLGLRIMRTLASAVEVASPAGDEGTAVLLVVRA